MHYIKHDDCPLLGDYSVFSVIKNPANLQRPSQRNLLRTHTVDVNRLVTSSMTSYIYLNRIALSLELHFNTTATDVIEHKMGKFC